MNDIPDYFNNRSHDGYCLFFKGKEVRRREAAILRQIWCRKHSEWREFSLVLKLSNELSQLKSIAMHEQF